MPPPLGDPTQRRDGGVRFISSVTLETGLPQMLVSHQFDTPKAVIVDVAIPIAQNQGQQLAAAAGVGFTNAMILGTGVLNAPVELWAFAIAKIGLSGCVYEIPFDVPLDSSARLACVCESLQISVGLVLKPDPSLSTFRRSNYDNPPYYAGAVVTTDSANFPLPSKLNIIAVGADGYAGAMSNLTRRVRVGLTSGSTSTLLPPASGTTAWRVQASPNIAITPSVTIPDAAAPYFASLALGTINGDGGVGDHVAPQNFEGLTLKNNGMATEISEVVWRLGLAGVMS